MNSKVSDFMASLNIPQQDDSAEGADMAVIGTQPTEQSGWHQAAQNELDKLRESESKHPHREKMIATILAIVDARLAGQSETAVFGRKDTCNVTTYHKKWKHRPAFAACLDNVTKLAQEWQDSKYIRALQTAAERLQLAAPTAAAKLVVLMGNPDPNVQYRAATAVLDRAGVETASKDGQLMNIIMNKIDLSRLTLIQIEALQSASTPADVIEILMQ